MEGPEVARQGVVGADDLGPCGIFGEGAEQARKKRDACLNNCGPEPPEGVTTENVLSPVWRCRNACVDTWAKKPGW